MKIIIFPVIVMTVGYLFGDTLTGTDREYYLLIIQSYKSYPFDISNFNTEPFFAFITYISSLFPFSPITTLNILMFASLSIKSFAFNRSIIASHKYIKVLYLILFSIIYGVCLYNRQELGSLRQAYSVGFVMLYFTELSQRLKLVWGFLIVTSHYSMGTLFLIYIGLDKLFLPQYTSSVLYDFRVALELFWNHLVLKKYSITYILKRWKIIFLLSLPLFLLILNRGHLIEYAFGFTDSINEASFYTINILSYYRFYTYLLPPILIMYFYNSYCLKQSLFKHFLQGLILI